MVSCDDVYILVSPCVKLRMGAHVMQVTGRGSATCLRMPFLAAAVNYRLTRVVEEIRIVDLRPTRAIISIRGGIHHRRWSQEHPSAREKEASTIRKPVVIVVEECDRKTGRT